MGYKCKNCGYEFNEGNFCPKCGTPVSAGKYPESDTPDVSLDIEEPVDYELYFDAKEKNVLRHVKKLMEFGDFDKAGCSLDALERDQINKTGEATAAVCYYKILIENRVTSEDALAKKLSGEKRSLKNNRNYEFAVSIAGDSYFRDRLVEIESTLEDEEKERAEKAKKTAEERLEKEKAIFEKRFAGFRKAMVTVLMCLVAALAVGIVLGTTLHNVSGGVVTVSTAFVSLVMFVVLGGMSLSKKNGTEYSVSGTNFVRKTSAKDKKIVLTFILAVIALSVVGFCFFLPVRTAADEGGITYSVASSYCYVTGYEGDASGVDIPSEYKGRPVVQIGSRAFKDDVEIIDVSIPKSVRKISVSAFEGCTSLEAVEMCGGVKVICEDAFLRCGSLSAIDLKGVRKIGVDAFGACANLAVVTLSDGLRTISKHAFMGCNHILEINIPSSVKTIKSQAFYNTTRLKCVYFAETEHWKRKGEGSVDPGILSEPVAAASLLVDDNKTWKHR